MEGKNRNVNMRDGVRGRPGDEMIDSREVNKLGVANVEPEGSGNDGEGHMYKPFPVNWPLYS